MVPYTLNIEEMSSDISPKIHFVGKFNQNLFLPDGRRCIASSINEADSLLENSPVGGFELNKAITATMIYPKVHFPEGETAWIQLTESDKVRAALLYVQLSLGQGYRATYLLESKCYSEVSWLHPPLEVDHAKNGNKSTYGLMALPSDYKLIVTRYHGFNPESVVTLSFSDPIMVAKPQLTDDLLYVI